MLIDTVSGGAETPIRVIKAGPEVQLPELSKNIGTWLQEHGPAQRLRATSS